LLCPVYGHFCSSGKGVYGFLTDSQGQASCFANNLPLSRPLFLFFGAGERIFCKNLDSPKPYILVALETKTTDATMTHE